MKLVTVALIQLAWTSREQMKQTYRELTRDAVNQGAEIVCLPELSLSPYFPATRDKTGFQWAEFLNERGVRRIFHRIGIRKWS